MNDVQIRISVGTVNELVIARQFHGGDGARPYYLAQKGNRLVYIHFYWQVQEDQLEKAMEILFAQTL